MKNHLQLQSLPPVTDNNITLFYFFNKCVDIKQLNNETLKAIGLPERIQQKIVCSLV